MYASRLPKRLSQTLAPAALLLILSVPPAHADTYALSTVAHTQSENFYGIDSAGDFAINVFDRFSNAGSNCGGSINPSSCYETFYTGKSTPVFSTAPPPLLLDNGSACTPAVPSGFGVNNGVCNGSHFIFSGYYNAANKIQLTGNWGGPNLDVTTSFLTSDLLVSGLINSRGDAVFIDTSNDTLVFARDLTASTAPEPASLLLCGTGGLTFLGAARRRLAR